MAAAELRGWRREEDEEKETKGRKGNDPSVLFIRQRTCVRRANPGATRFGRGVAALGIIEGVINIKLHDDVMPVYSNQR